MSVLHRRGDATIVSPGSSAAVSCTKVSAQSDGYQAASVLRPSPNDQSPSGPAAKSGLDPPRQGGGKKWPSVWPNNHEAGRCARRLLVWGLSMSIVVGMDIAGAACLLCAFTLLALIAVELTWSRRNRWRG